MVRRSIALAALAALVGFGPLLLAGIARAEDPAATVRVIPEYHLGSGDKVRVTTFGEEALSGDFLVSGSGKVALPLVGEIAAAGLTPREFQERVETALKEGYLKEPRVSVEVLNYRPFYILGEVKSPGTYPFTNGLTVMNAVATAGGFTYRANIKKVFIKRAEADKEMAYPLTDLTPVAPGDTIRIAERLF
ncbi:MAG: polysaccharide biosynthesis/export family protein [Phenylobacterium sp.]